MKKMMLLAGLLVFGAMGYAATEASFEAHVKVIKPLTVSVGDKLEFGEVAAGSKAIEATPVKLNIEGEQGKNVKIEYLINDAHIEKGMIDLKNGENKIQARLSFGNGNFPQSGIENTTFGINGKIEKNIKGLIYQIPSDAKSGDYNSDPVTIKVQYQ